MRAKAPGAPLDSCPARPDVNINCVDSYHIRLAVTGTSCDKYPGMSRYCPCGQEKLRRAGMPLHAVYTLS